jgi:hypothetical protein
MKYAILCQNFLVAISFVTTYDSRMKRKRFGNMGGTIIAIEGESRGEFVSEGKRHSSETDMEGIVPNITIKNDGTIARLKDKVLKAVGGL